MPAPTPLLRSVAKTLADGYINAVARLGFGTSAKSAADSYMLAAELLTANPAEIEAAYRTSWFRKVVDIPPFDMTRQWRHWQAKKDQIQKIEDEEKRLGVLVKVRQAMTWARLTGGAGILLGVNDGLPSSAPLDPERVAQGGLQFIHPMSRDTLSAGELDRDPLSPTFGQPTLYRISGGNRPETVIHPTRVIRFVGNEIPDSVTTTADGWGDSLWFVLKRAISSSDAVMEGLASLVHEAKIDVIKIPNLMENLATQAFEDKLVNRLAAATRAKSINNALLLDANEEYDQKQITFSSLPDVAKIFLAVMSGMADIPATRLLGKSPDGQNATGDSDLRNYYDMLKSRQSNELTPAMNPLDECLIRSALGNRPEEIYSEWNPLWQMTPQEKAEVDNKNADTIGKIALTGLVPDVALAKGVQNKIVEDGILPGMDQALADAEADGELPSALTEPTPGEIAMAALAAKTADPGNPANQNTPPPKGKPSSRAVNDAMPRTLYVRRQVQNAADIIAWAKAQGFEQTVPPKEMHVTIAFSRELIDWQKAGNADDWGSVDKDGVLTIPPGGPRSVEPLGPHGALVLMFASSALSYRWWRLRDTGASWEYGDDYQPHITLTYEETGLDWRKITPYRGKIVLGPEIFEEVADDWAKSLVEEET